MTAEELEECCKAYCHYATVWFDPQTFHQWPRLDKSTALQIQGTIKRLLDPGWRLLRVGKNLYLHVAELSEFDNTWEYVQQGVLKQGPKNTFGYYADEVCKQIPMA